MCLLIVLSRTLDDPLVVGANRDELYERPASPMAVLRAASPRVLGGRDQLGGGTWLAVNEAGVFAGVTNQPVASGRDPAKRSRGELPLLLVRHRSAEESVAKLAVRIDPARYNPAWILVGDRHSLYALDVSEERALGVQELPPGLHVLENRPLGAPSAKVERVLAQLSGIEQATPAQAVLDLRRVLADHEVPVSDEREQSSDIPLGAACVHSERYGTRWSALVTVPAPASEPPQFLYAPGAPCKAAYLDATTSWGRR